MKEPLSGKIRPAGMLFKKTDVIKKTAVKQFIKELKEKFMCCCGECHNEIYQLIDKLAGEELVE